MTITNNRPKKLSMPHKNFSGCLAVILSQTNSVTESTVNEGLL